MEILDKQTKEKMLYNIGAVIKQKAIELCPTDKGQLRNSFQVEIIGDTVKVFTDLEHAEDMEYGKPPEPLSTQDKRNLEDWSRRHGLNEKQAQGVIWKIQKKGIKVGTENKPLHITGLGRDSYRPFLRPALHQTEPQFKEIINSI